MTATFLDLVRKVGEITRDRCHPECELGQHRQEAARYLGVVLENPDLLRALVAISRQSSTDGVCGNGG